MTKVTLMGAGGKMGVRLATNLMESDHDVSHVEIDPVGKQRLKDETGIDCVNQNQALSEAEAVILAVPDRLIGKVLSGFVNELSSGTAVIMLDAAAPHAETLPNRDDITYFVAHPCHPPLFNDETAPDAKKDYFGGIAAKQHIICALAQGPEEHYAMCEKIARDFYRPVMRSHRCTVEQMALLEPALSESVGATFAKVLKGRHGRSSTQRGSIPSCGRLPTRSLDNSTCGCIRCSAGRKTLGRMYVGNLRSRTGHLP